MTEKKHPLKGKPTPREKDVLAAIRLYQKKNKRPPTFTELGEMLGFSKHGALAHCRNMRFKGLVTWTKWSPRTLRIL